MHHCFKDWPGLQLKNPTLGATYCLHLRDGYALKMVLWNFRPQYESWQLYMFSDLLIEYLPAFLFSCHFVKCCSYYMQGLFRCLHSPLGLMCRLHVTHICRRSCRSGKADYIARAGRQRQHFVCGVFNGAVSEWDLWCRILWWSKQMWKEAVVV
jgi:hypothetical protein